MDLSNISQHATMSSNVFTFSTFQNCTPQRRKNGMRACVHAKSLPSYPTLCDPKDYSQPGSSVHGMLQARVLEWVDLNM